MTVNHAPAANQAPALTEEQQVKIAEAAAKSEEALLHRVFYPTFFSILKEAGYAPRNDDEAGTLLHMAAQVRAAKQQSQVKQASKNRFSSYAAELEQLGYGQSRQQESEIKYAAFHAMQNDPTIYGAALQLAEIEAALAAQP